MKFIETLFLGFLIACAALIAQVFFEVVAEIFFHTEIIIRYSPTDTTQHILMIMVIAATIEEVIRYLFIKKRTSLHIDHSLIDPILYGTLLGVGFVTLEIIFI
ncbi:MAG: PrsW family glutamic-type intramembrane protease, partial [Patescibacteria group bacterium]|nr:PrsW family glutamic-type intramembrane protease [Patescibacteria group bacterium]